jgi:hypothetical protein
MAIAQVAEAARKSMMRVEGIEQIEKALAELTFRKRQNVERKAARAALNKLKKSVQMGWRTLSVENPSPKRWSIRKHAAKAVTVKVGTKRYQVYGRLFLNYQKKNASMARLAHLLEWSHKTGGPRPGVDQAKRSRKRVENSRQGFSAGKHPTANVYQQKSGHTRDFYMKALMLWLMNPKLTQKQVRNSI